MANWLLERLGVDVALAGDILEEYELRRSRVSGGIKGSHFRRVRQAPGTA
jgi:hypothetical protein